MRIVIVEDEIRIREGLAKLVRKIDPSFEIVAEADDGLSGMRVIEEKRPDLVITDVRMPDMGGLEMLSRLREKAVRPRAIVLSAYSEFAYAREAIALGVGEYLLKPVNVVDLSRSLKNAAASLAADLASRNAGGRQSLESVLYSALSGIGSPGEEDEALLAERYRVDAAGRFSLVSLYLGKKFDAENRRMAGKIRALLSARPGGDYCLIELPKSGVLAIFLYGFDDEAALKHWFGSAFVTEIRRCDFKDFCCAWISFTGLSNLKTSMQELDSILDWNLVLRDGTMIVGAEAEAVPRSTLSYPIALENQVRSALCGGELRRFQEGVGEFQRYLHSGRIHAPKEIKEAAIRFFWAVLNAAREVAYDKYESIVQQEVLERITSAVTWAELESATGILMRLAPEKAEEGAAGAGIVNRTKNLVREFYSQGITLEEIAEKIKVTPEYLSAQFHRETGVNFSAYIKDFRIRKAKELLIGSDLKLYAVAEKVGYRDAKYFCRVFKEATGRNPSDYRRMNR